MKAIYPGTFTPLHDGHKNIIIRASKIFDTLIILCAHNRGRKADTTQEAKKQVIAFVKESKIKNIEVKASAKKMTVDIAKANGCKVIIRGLRNAKDLDYELETAAINRSFNSEIETLYLLADSSLSRVSSSALKVAKKLGYKVK